MTTALLCTDGSELGTAALRTGVMVLAAADRTVVVTVVDVVDPSLVVGVGMAGGVISPDQAQRESDDRLAAGRAVLADTVQALGLGGAETTVVMGAPGPAICELAESLPADVIILGTRGHGGLRRAVLGSVSDHVVRNAPCPVLTVQPDR